MLLGIFVAILVVINVVEVRYLFVFLTVPIDICSTYSFNPLSLFHHHYFITATAV